MHDAQSPAGRYGPRASALGIKELAARVEALAPYALASFVNGKFNSAGVEGFCVHNYPER